ncbi:HEPN domain-containing protein [Micromonospora sp. NPDC048842]|uniref:ApeA N-terminal domain 1-containing protein n=1 Tax=Micromonospora sp. NPDC048842 TaxID=3154346 RepID=UPI0033C231C6
MQPLDVMGSFWLPGHERIARYGRLVFNTKDGGTLHLSDALAEMADNGETTEKEGGKRNHVVGYIHEPNCMRPVTLLDCLWLSPTKYHAHMILIGAHFEREEDTVFDSVSVRFNDAAAWVGKDAISDDVDLAVGGVERRELVVRLDRPPSKAARFERGAVALDFRWSRQDVDHKSLTIEQWPQFELTYDEKTPVGEIVEDTGHICNLMSLCTDRPGLFESVYLYRADLPMKALSGDPFPDSQQAIELKARLGDRSLPGNARVLSAPEVPVPFDDIGIAGVATWLNQSPSITPIIGALLTMRHHGIYSENRFLNIASAAEGLHRATVGGRYLPESAFRRLRRQLREHVPEEHHKWFNDLMGHANAPSLVQRLTELTGELGDSVHSLVGNNVEAWIQAIKRIRNDLTHLDEDRPMYDGGDLLHLAESLFHVTRLCLLLRIGLNPDRLPWITRTIRFRGNFVRVEDAIERIFPPRPAVEDSDEVTGGVTPGAQA